MAIDIHRALGPGMLERAYVACLCHEFQRRGIRFERERPIPLVYDGFILECVYRADVIVEGAIVLEVKAIETLAGVHSRQMVTYLKLTDCRRTDPELRRRNDACWDQANREPIPGRMILASSLLRASA